MVRAAGPWLVPHPVPEVGHPAPVPHQVVPDPVASPVQVAHPVVVLPDEVVLPDGVVAPVVVDLRAARVVVAGAQTSFSRWTFRPTPPQMLRSRPAS